MAGLHKNLGNFSKVGDYYYQAAQLVPNTEKEKRYSLLMDAVQAYNQTFYDSTIISILEEAKQFASTLEEKIDCYSLLETFREIIANNTSNSKAKKIDDEEEEETNQACASRFNKQFTTSKPNSLCSSRFGSSMYPDKPSQSGTSNSVSKQFNNNVPTIR